MHTLAYKFSNYNVGRTSLPYASLITAVCRWERPVKERLVCILVMLQKNTRPQTHLACKLLLSWQHKNNFSEIRVWPFYCFKESLKKSSLPSLPFKNGCTFFITLRALNAPSTTVLECVCFVLLSYLLFAFRILPAGI